MQISNRWISVSAGLVAGLLSFAASSSFAAAPSTEQKLNLADVDQVDVRAEDLSSEDFLQSLHVINLSEIDMARMSMDRSKDKDVNNYGRILLRDHSLADEAIRFIAKQKGISFEAGSFTDQTNSLKQNLDAAMARIDSAPEQDFRNVLSQVGVEGHQQGLDLIKRAQSEVSDRTVRALAFLLEPVFQSHLKQAQQLQAAPQPQ